MNSVSEHTETVDDRPPPLIQQLRDQVFGPPRPKTWWEWLSPVVQALLVVIGIVAFGVVVWEENPGHHVEAMAAYVGAVTFFLAVIKPVAEYVDRYGWWNRN